MSIWVLVVVAFFSGEAMMVEPMEMHSTLEGCMKDKKVTEEKKLTDKVQAVGFSCIKVTQTTGKPV